MHHTRPLPLTLEGPEHMICVCVCGGGGGGGVEEGGVGGQGKNCQNVSQGKPLKLRLHLGEWI